MLCPNISLYRGVDNAGHAECLVPSWCIKRLLTLLLLLGYSSSLYRGSPKRAGLTRERQRSRQPLEVICTLVVRDSRDHSELASERTPQLRDGASAFLIQESRCRRLWLHFQRYQHQATALSWQERAAPDPGFGTMSLWLADLSPS